MESNSYQETSRARKLHKWHFMTLTARTMEPNFKHKDKSMMILFTLATLTQPLITTVLICGLVQSHAHRKHSHETYETKVKQVTDPVNFSQTKSQIQNYSLKIYVSCMNKTFFNWLSHHWTFRSSLKGDFIFTALWRYLNMRSFASMLAF